MSGWKIYPYNKSRSVQRIAEYLSQGACVFVPTETVYGLAAKADHQDAIDMIYTLKKRPISKSLVWQYHRDEVFQQPFVWHQYAQDLAAHFWPGPLTLVLKSLDTNSTQAVRVSSHPFVTSLTRCCRFPIAMTSANFSHYPEARTPNEVMKIFHDTPLPLVYDAKASKYKDVSTVVDATHTDYFCILRLGSLSIHDLQKVTSVPVKDNACVR